jgi:hypothetical protein
MSVIFEVRELNLNHQGRIVHGDLIHRRFCDNTREAQASRVLSFTTHYPTAILATSLHWPTFSSLIR